MNREDCHRMAAKANAALSDFFAKIGGLSNGALDSICWNLRVRFRGDELGDVGHVARGVVGETQDVIDETDLDSDPTIGEGEQLTEYRGYRCAEDDADESGPLGVTDTRPTLNIERIALVSLAAAGRKLVKADDEGSTTDYAAGLGMLRFALYTFGLTDLDQRTKDPAEAARVACYLSDIAAAAGRALQCTANARQNCGGTTAA